MAGPQQEYKTVGSLPAAATPVVDDDLFLVSRGGAVIGKVAAAAIKLYTAAAPATLTSKSISADTNTISDLEVDNFKAGVIDTDGTLAANSDTHLPSQKAVRTYVDALLAAQDAMVFKGVIDCSADPNYPAANCGWTYRVSVAGKIGGAVGVSVEPGDLLLCLTDGTASGDQATVGTSWNVTQVNMDGAVIGPAGATDSHLVLFDGATGKWIKSGGATTSFGRGLVALADAAALRTAGEMGRFRGSVTFSALLALTGNLLGDTAHVTDAGERGSLWIFDGALWSPVGGEYIHQKRSGTFSAPLATVTGVTVDTAFAITTLGIAPNILRAGSRLSAECVVRKRGANATWAVRVRLGPLFTASDPALLSVGSISISDGAVFRPCPAVAFLNNTTGTITGSVVPGGSFVSGGEPGGLNCAVEQRLTITAHPGSASDFIDLISYVVRVCP